MTSSKPGGIGPLIFLHCGVNFNVGVEITAVMAGLQRVHVELGGI